MRSSARNKSISTNTYEHNDADSLNSDIISQEDKDTNYGSRSHPHPHSYPNSDKNDISTNDVPLNHELNDPWSSDPWNDTGISWGDNTASSAVGPLSTNYNHIETSFESLQFRPVPKSDSAKSNNIDDPFDSSGQKFNLDKKNQMKKKSSHTTNYKQASSNIIISETRIGVIIQERLSILFDDATGTKDPICKVVGSIYVKPTRRKINSFCLTVRDKRAHVEQWDEQHIRCRNITSSVPHLALDPGDQVFLISLKRENQQVNKIVDYTCISRLKPMPMLLKTKLHNRNNRCRLGIRIRANPQNSYVLTDIVILIICPLDVDGENVTMSRKGGAWDGMKRSIIWTIHKLDPGEIVDIQAQFKCIQEGGVPLQNNSVGFESLSSLKFPVLARCNGDTNYSKIDMNSDYNEEGSNPVKLDMERSATILYRKV
mmetsp:Transcript_9154/g.10670  ORF Transcript_9154/g.10670 Transcript_9154/m.10670 type:complete len:429 (-) Transcript_9154:3-1289(-)